MKVSGAQRAQAAIVLLQTLAALFMAAAVAAPAPAADGCRWPSDSPDVRAALADIRRSIDPCGETNTVAQLLSEFEHCARNSYAVCINRKSERNSIDRANDETGATMLITWNPDLRTELEVGCNADPTRPVLRDPVASLLHEVAHAVQDCHGLDPNEHELEAVQIENIYRRARGLCQRTAYGPQPLPAGMVVACEPDSCLCTAGKQPAQIAQPAGISEPVAKTGDAASDTP